ncbi:MAG: TetR/AcrR family transcriptional regulator [Pseudomonadota bacterium]
MISSENDQRRPGRPKSLEKQAAIRQAAADMFLSVGWEGTSMDAVAAAAGVSKQTVYSHFRSKDDLFRACVRSKKELYQLEVDPSAQPDLATGLARFARSLLELLRDPEVMAMYRLLVAHCMDFPKLVRNFHEAGPEAGLETVRRLLLHFEPEVFANQADAAACDFIAQVHHRFFAELLLALRPTIDDGEIREHVERSVRLFRRAYGIDAAGNGDAGGRAHGRSDA